MEFNSKSNQVEFVISPANISEEANKEAKELAVKLAESLDLVGVLAVEMFLTKDKIYVNEIAPRVHNSGHWTMDGSYSSQFQQHIRAIMDLPLLSTERHSDIIMYNLIGKVTSKLADNELAKILSLWKERNSSWKKNGSH